MSRAEVKGLTPSYVTCKVADESGADFAFSSLGLACGLLKAGTL